MPPSSVAWWASLSPCKLRTLSSALVSEAPEPGRNRVGTRAVRPRFLPGDVRKERARQHAAAGATLDEAAARALWARLHVLPLAVLRHARRPSADATSDAVVSGDEPVGAARFGAP